jgi:hypothetical protein
MFSAGPGTTYAAGKVDTLAWPQAETAAVTVQTGLVMPRRLC